MVLRETALPTTAVSLSMTSPSRRLSRFLTFCVWGPLHGSTPGAQAPEAGSRHHPHFTDELRPRRFRPGMFLPLLAIQVSTHSQVVPLPFWASVSPSVILRDGIRSQRACPACLRPSSGRWAEGWRWGQRRQQREGPEPALPARPPANPFSRSPTEAHPAPREERECTPSPS